MRARTWGSLFILCLLMAGQPHVAGAAARLAPDSAVEASLVAPEQLWKASPPAEDCIGPVDGAGRAWTDPAFDDSAWTYVELPEANTIPAGQDRYYRLHYSMLAVSRTEIILSGDDSVLLYVNGEQVGQWGGECHAEGSADGIRLDLTPYLHVGENIIAAHVSNGPGDSWFDAGVSSAAVLRPTPRPPARRSGLVAPAECQAAVEVIAAYGTCTGVIGLMSPYNTPIFTDYRDQQGLSFPIEQRFPAGTELIFFWQPAKECGGGSYLSTDAGHAQLVKVDSDTWDIHWAVGKDYGVAIEVKLRPAPGGFLDLPYDYRGSTFAAESRDPEQGGRVTATFDHDIPGACQGTTSGKCYPWDTRAVQFYGYDGTSGTTQQSGYKVYYNGHSGVDYALPQGKPVLAAAAGIVTFAGDITVTCSDGRARTAKVVKVGHANGYSTQYWHLSSIAVGVVPGAYIERNPAYPLGTVGQTGCATGPHLHFAVANPSGDLVDPYGWSPRPDTPWYGAADPSRQSRIGGSSDYLWIHPLRASAVTADSRPTVLYSTSGTVRATLPAGSTATPVRLELTDALPSVRIRTRQSLHVFSLVAFAPDGAPRLVWDQPLLLEVRLPTGRLRSIPAGLEPRFLVWDAEAGLWEALPTNWDPASRIASTSSARLGTYALTAEAYTLYLPFLSNGDPLPPDMPAPADAPQPYLPRPDVPPKSSVHTRGR